MSISRNEFNVLVCFENELHDKTEYGLAQALNLTVEQAAMETSGLVARSLLTESLKLTELGKRELEPYRAKRMIFLAAGLGSRLRPATINVPKPMVRVHGKPIICSAIEAGIEAGIEDIYIVRGYLGESFETLLHQYPKLHLLDNTLYSKTNNISSALCVKDLLENAYIMEADLLINNPRVIRKYNYTSNCLGVPVSHTDDWCILSENGRVTQLSQGGENCHHLYSIYYWTAQDGRKLPAHLVEMFNSPGGCNCFWDNAPLNMFNDQYSVEVIECSFDDITEIDTYEELQRIDSQYVISK